MGVEIEAKMKVANLDAVRKTLTHMGAVRKKMEMEVNAFFDKDSGELKKADKGLRLRTARNLDSGEARYIITMKGPLRDGELKTREEIELTVTDPKAVEDLFVALGFKKQLSFEKRRETWEFMECEIALDEVARLGTYVEIEGPGDDAVMGARRALGLGEHALIRTGYIALLAKDLEENGIREREIRL